MNTPQTTPERRENLRVREVFVQACALISPVIAANDTIKTVSNFAMAHMLSEHFPELSTTEVHIVIVTAEKLHREQRLQAILHKKG